jgi:hypothetical protein
LACGSDEVDIKLFTTSPQTGLYVDLINQGKVHTKLRRRVYQHGKPLIEGLVAYEELKLDDLKMRSNFNAVMAVWFDASLCRHTNAGEVVSAHGWHGALNFQAACHTLHGIHVDEGEEEVGMVVQGGETVLLVDWDKDDADIKLGVIPTPTTQNKGYDFAILDADVKKTCELFNPPKIKVGGLPIGRIFELDDVPYGTAFQQMAILEYDLTNMRSTSVRFDPYVSTSLCLSCYGHHKSRAFPSYSPSRASLLACCVSSDGFLSFLRIGANGDQHYAEVTSTDGGCVSPNAQSCIRYSNLLSLSLLFEIALGRET